MTKENADRKELERLGRELRRFEGINLDDSAKIRMKNNLMSKLEIAEFSQYSSIIMRVKDLANQIVLSVAGRTRIKERVFDAIPVFQQRKMLFPRIFIHNSKKLVSAFLVFVMMLGAISVFTLNTMVVRASSFTRLESFTLGVYIQREGQKLLPFQGMVLYEGDKIYTDENASASIKYFDNSVTRLAANSEITIDKLIKPDNSNSRSYVEVSLNNGVLWSRVFNLVGKGSAFVVKANDVYASAKKGAFNVEFNDKKLEVEVFSNIVDVGSVNDGTKVEKVVSGKKAAIEDRRVAVVDLGKNDTDIAWVKDNLNSDKKEQEDAENQLIAAKKEMLGVDDAESINFDVSLQEKALVFLTFDDVKKKKLELDLAEKNFIGAEIKLKGEYLTKGEKAEINDVILDFEKKVNDFYKTIEDVEKVDPEYGQELHAYIDDKLLTLKKELGLSSKATVYELKSVVDELIVSGAKTPEDAAEIKLDQTLDKLADVSQVAANGDKELANDLMLQDKENVGDAIENIEKIDDSKVDEKAELVDKASEYFQVLDSIEGIENDDDMDEIKEKVAEMERDVNEVNNDGVASDEAGAGQLQPEESPYGVNVTGGKPLPPGL
ncbi:MAG: FecR family protein [Candidatus Gracilibacteria bacterium]|jgi:hypothetical protein